METPVAPGEHALGLTALAHSRSAPDRERLLMAVVDICEGAQASSPGRVIAVQPMLGDLFARLVAEAQSEVRRKLAERIGGADWAPKRLIDLLVLDQIEIARPVIAASPLLMDEDLIRLLGQATLDHQIEVARRPGLGGPVVDAILEAREGLVLTALAGNETAEIRPPAMARLVEESRKCPALRSPLARHPGLTPELAERLYLWVGESLKTAIAARFRIDPAALQGAVANAVRDLTDSAPSLLTIQERESTERRLVDKLHAAGQLRSGYLLRALRERKLSLFEAALAKLGGLQASEVRLAINADGAESLALACLAAGIDRSVFPTILDLVRTLNDGRPSGAGNGVQSAGQIFADHTARTAAGG